jgi:hypothetical protein
LTEHPFFKEKHMQIGLTPKDLCDLVDQYVTESWERNTITAQLIDVTVDLDIAVMSLRALRNHLDPGYVGPAILWPEGERNDKRSR